MNVMRNEKLYGFTVGIDGEFEEFDIDIMSYCSSTCFNGFHDDEGGYYAVYR